MIFHSSIPNLVVTRFRTRPPLHTEKEKVTTWVDEHYLVLHLTSNAHHPREREQRIQLGLGLPVANW